jgi:transcriptional regulator with XRE-family HTH domain
MTLETANRLYELRKKNNLSQEELAEKLGVSRQAVSKWERSEASPDTDNLIGLAKIYGLSLDELIYGKKEETKEETQEEPKDETKEEKTEGEKLFVDIDDGEDKVKIGPEGIFVERKDGEKVKISFNGIKIENIKSDGSDYDDYDDEDDEDDEVDDELYETVFEEIKNTEKGNTVHVKVSRPTKFWLEVPYPIICAIAYLIFGFYNIYGGWALSWVIFVTIPIYYSFIEAIYKRRFSEFAYPVLTAFVYLVLGLYFGNWHPSWIIFLTIPVYGAIASALDKKIKR